MNSNSTDAPGSSPINDFSQCHVGILSHLQALAGLPVLLEPAARARRIAAETLAFFRDAVFEHHAEEESELFPAVLASAAPGAERDKVLALTKALTAEHRKVESAWSSLEPKLQALVKGHDSKIDGAEITALVHAYQAHARYEEEVFLPLSQDILGRNDNHLAALGVSLHIRHALPDLVHRFGSRI